MKTDGEPPTNQASAGKLPQNKLDNMVSRKKQQTNTKAKAAAATAAAADAMGAEAGATNNNQDLPMNDVNFQADTIQGDSVGSNRNRDGTVANMISEEGTQTSVTHTGTDCIAVPNMGESAIKAKMNKNLSTGG